MSIAFTVDYEVQAKQGDRSFYNQRLGRVMHFPDAKVVRNSDALVALCAQHVPAKPMEGPVALSLAFTFPWPASMSRRKREQCRGWKSTKPDLDNLEKQVCDVLQKAGFFLNDSQIAMKTTSKRYGDRHRLTVDLGPIHQTTETYTNGKDENAQLPLLV